jgi:polyisoprenoid-binding protein YceI
MIQETKWTIDKAHSEIAFKIKHLMISYVRGTFEDYDSTVFTVGNDFSTAVIDVWINIDSINTGDEKRDKHLQSAEFFDVEKYPQIIFRANTLKESVDGHLEMAGDLKMRDVTKGIRLNVEFGGLTKDSWGKEKAGFSVKGTINRKDWGLIWNTKMETGGFMLGDEVVIDCEIQLIKVNDTHAKMENAMENEETVPGE